MNIEHNFQILASPETVYDAVSTPAGIRGWWSKNSAIAEFEGGAHLLHFKKGDQNVSMHFKVDELNPGNKVAWTCTNNGNPAWINTTLMFEIQKSEGGVEFRLLHAGFDEQWKDTPPFQATAEGWKPFMKSLKSYCETGSGQPM